MSYSSWRDASLAACKQARVYFSQELAELMEFEPEVGAFEHLGQYLTQKVIFFLLDRQGHNREFPNSVSDFLQTISPAFHRKYLDGFEISCNRFDRMIDGSNPSSSTSFWSSHQAPTPNLSNVFICDLSFKAWIAKICKAIALHCFETLGIPIYEPIIQYDGPSVENVPIPSFQAGVFDDGGPFKQVTLVGPSLHEAWNRLSFTRDLEGACPQTPLWTPTQPGGMYVYHGTAAHLANDSFILNLANRPFNGLVGMSNRNQITPWSTSLPVVWTAFSPFRAFLWAVFNADVICNIPGSSAQSKLTRAWQFGNKTYEGVLLLQFSSTQPNPPGCSSYIIPTGREEQWSAIATTSVGLASSEPTKNLWARFATIHQQAEESEWPDLIHGLELRSSRESLRPFTKQFWRTVWFSQGIQALNSCHQQSLAIRCIIKPDSPQLPHRELPIKGSTKDKGSRHKKLDSLKRHVSSIFK